MSDVWTVHVFTLSATFFTKTDDRLLAFSIEEGVVIRVGGGRNAEKEKLRPGRRGRSYKVLVVALRCDGQCAIPLTINLAQRTNGMCTVVTIAGASVASRWWWIGERR